MSPVRAHTQVRPYFKLKLHTKNFLIFRLSFFGMFPIVLLGKNGYSYTQIKLIRIFPRNSSGFSPENNPKAPGLVTFHALTAIWRLPSRFSEVGKMGMIAFYAGLFIGILFGFLLASLLAFSLAKRKDGALPDQADG